MTAIAAWQTREEKEKWLLRPVDWASCVAMFGGFMTLAMLYAGVERPTVLCVAIGANIVTFVLLTWGIARIKNKARGRA